MTDPKWNSETKLGTMARGALWLVQVVGEGNTFTKADLREAFPDVAQADRRIRDLRKYGWVIGTNVTDAALRSDEQRFVSAGLPVWDSQTKRIPDSLPSKKRAEIFRADGYQCVDCGVAGGESYPDGGSGIAVLGAYLRGEPKGYVTLCKRCGSAAETGEQARFDDATAAIESLQPEELAKLSRWVRAERRGTTSLDRAWLAIRRLPHEQRDAIRKLLDATRGAN